MQRGVISNETILPKECRAGNLMLTPGSVKSKTIVLAQTYIARLDRLHRKITDLISLAELRIAHRIRIVVVKECTAEPVVIGAGVSIILDRKVDGVDEIRVCRSTCRTA